MFLRDWVQYRKEFPENYSVTGTIPLRNTKCIIILQGSCYKPLLVTFEYTRVHWEADNLPKILEWSPWVSKLDSTPLCCAQVTGTARQPDGIAQAMEEWCSSFLPSSVLVGLVAKKLSEPLADGLCVLFCFSEKEMRGANAGMRGATSEGAPILSHSQYFPFWGDVSSGVPRPFLTTLTSASGTDTQSKWSLPRGLQYSFTFNF